MNEICEKSLKNQIHDLKRAVEVSGMSHDSLMWKMLESSLEQVQRAYANGDFATVERGLANTKSLLGQCTL
jgi:hypothetical protein